MAALLGDYVEFDIMNGRFIIVYYGTMPINNKSLITLAEFVNEVKTSGALAYDTKTFNF